MTPHGVSPHPFLAQMAARVEEAMEWAAVEMPPPSVAGVRASLDAMVKFARTLAEKHMQEDSDGAQRQL